MKKLLVTTLMIASSFSFARYETQLNSVSLMGEDAALKEYLGSCYVGRPLYQYEEPCSLYSNAGYRAINCAIKNAIAQCRKDRNLDCVVVHGSKLIRVEPVLEFPGLIKCIGSVQVRGYKLN